MRACAVVAIVCLWTLPVYANNTDEARDHYERASAHFAVGEFADAAEEYQAAYKLKPDPALLYNAAQAYRLAGNNEKALVLYRNYLQFYPNQSNADDVRAQIAKLREALAAVNSAKTAPPTGTVEPKTQKIAPQPETSAPNATAPLTPAVEREHAANEPARVPIYKRWWLWTAVGAVVVAGAVVAIVFASRPNATWNNLPDFGPGKSSSLTVQW